MAHMIPHFGTVLGHQDDGPLAAWTIVHDGEDLAGAGTSTPLR